MNDTPGSPGACPGKEELAAYLVGDIPSDELEQLAAHVADCPRCESFLFDNDNNTLVAWMKLCLREGASETDAWADAKVAPLIRALARGPASHAAGTASGARPEPVVQKPAEFTPTAFGKYLLLEVLGRGGMGVVYRARHLALNREEALKKIRAGGHADPRDRTRFHTEAQAVARLEHPHVIKIYDFGEEDGVPYFAMELAEGGSLARRLAGGPLLPREAAELVLKLAQAVQAAHERQIVHRDLKPGNVLLMKDGTPKITDFGLAKLLDLDTNNTQSDAVLGTASYMAPEQARGHLKEVGPRTDVYALGAILYETLTGRPPFRGANWFKTLEQVKRNVPAAPSGLRKGVSAEIEEITLRCLEKNPARRYPSALALAEDLARWLRGDYPLVRSRPWFVRGLRALRRHPRGVAAVCACGLLAGLSLFLAWAFDPDRPMHEIEATLAREKKVTLIGESGMPRWLRVRAGDAATQVSESHDGYCSVHTWDYCLVELLRDPRSKKFRFRAQVRHEKSQQDRGEVGLYCFHRELPVAGVHFFAHLSFNDVISRGEILKNLDLPGLPRTNLNLVTLTPRLLRRAPTQVLPPIEIRNGRWIPAFEPAGLAGGRWRPLEIVSDGETVRGIWDGKKEVCRVSLADIKEDARRVVMALRQAYPEDRSLDTLVEDFPAHGSLGLFVLQGSVSFKNVCVERID